MKDVLTIVEQLDRAARELETDHPINNRIALILVDNATELMVHWQCMDHLENDNLSSGLQKALQAHANIDSPEPRPDSPGNSQRLIMQPKQRAMARGKFLGDKLKVLEALGDLTSPERRFMGIAHDYRNEMYHAGLAHDDITRAIAGHYYLLCCDLFVRMGDLGIFLVSLSPNDEYTEIGKRYVAGPDGEIDFLHLDKEAIAGKLRAGIPEGIPALAITLADSARKAIKAVLDDFQFLVRDNPYSFDAEVMLEIAQWQLDLNRALEQEDLIGLWVDPNYRKSLARVAADLESKWQQKHTSLPDVKWMQRATILENEPDPLVALDLYQSLRQDMAYLEEAILAASEELDRWIQHEVDRARGK